MKTMKLLKEWSMSFSNILLTISTLIFTSLLMFAVPTALERSKANEDKTNRVSTLASQLLTKLAAEPQTKVSNNIFHPVVDNRTLLHREDFDPFMADLTRRIKRAWFPPKGWEGKRVTVVFTIHRGGELANLALGHSSGVAGANEAALRAVERAAPFRPIPNGNKQSIDIRFIFDIRELGIGHGTIISF
jgi:TonB family protein